MTQDEGALTRFLVNSSRAVTAIAERRDDLAGLVGNANATAGGDRRRERRARRARSALLPTTLRRANTTFVNLRATLDDLDVLVAASKPATKDLAPFLRELRPLVHDARPDDPRPAHARPPRRPGQRPRRGDAQDAAAAARRHAGVPQRPPGAAARPQPVLEFVRPYTPDLVGWLRDFGQGAANYDANGHFARIQPIFNAFQFTDNPAGGVLTPIPPIAALRRPADRPRSRRCPGAATQAAAGRLRAVHRRRQPSTATPASCRPGHEARRRHRRR